MADPVQTQTYTSNIPQELLPYEQTLLDTAAGFTDIAKNPYQQYQGERVAQTSPLLQQAQDTASQMGVAGQVGSGTALAGAAGLEALNPYSFTDAGVAQQYMSPYMQNVMDVQSQQAKRQADIAAQQQQAQAVNAGAFGGGRDAIMRSQANAELQRNLQGIQATGLQNAYQQGMQQYNQEQTQRMQGLGLANQSASTLGNLGQEQFNQTSGIVGLQGQLGQLEQQRTQQGLDAQYQDYLNYQNYPYKQMGFMSDLLRGVPTTTSASSIYQAPPTTTQSLLSLGLGAAGLSSLFGTGKAAGGEIKGYANGGTVGYDNGGSVFSPNFKDYAVSHIDPRQLPVAQRNAQARGDLDTAQYAAEQMAQDAALRRGIASTLPQGTEVVRAAGGGILAFKEDGLVPATTDAEDGPSVDGTQLAGLADLLGGKVDPRALARAESAVGRLANTPQRTVTPEEQREMTGKFYEQEVEQAGPNTGLNDYKDFIAETKTGLSQALEQGKGLALLEAAGAALEGNDALRGMGKAGATFSKTYGEAIKADRAQKEHLAKAQFLLADAERKERMGFTKSAQASTAAHVKQVQEANKQDVLKNKYVADASVQLAKATKQGGAGGAGAAGKEFMVGPSKLEPQIRAENPGQSDDWYKAEAYRQYKRLAPGVPGAEIRAESTEQTEAGKRFDQALLLRQADIRKAQKAGDTDKVNQIRAEVAAESGFKLPKAAAAPSQKGGAGVTVSAGGKTYTFPDQASANQFKAAAGIK
jgi:hypothetical protein